MSIGLRRGLRIFCCRVIWCEEGDSILLENVRCGGWLWLPENGARKTREESRARALEVTAMVLLRFATYLGTVVLFARGASHLPTVQR